MVMCPLLQITLSCLVIRTAKGKSVKFMPATMSGSVEEEEEMKSWERYVKSV
tara:strand:- start:83 stop:238 length:156 start_codon:yes stop_codon:yes gene_type:complete